MKELVQRPSVKAAGKSPLRQDSVERVLFNVMEYLDIGIVVLDLSENRVIYRNSGAVALLTDEVNLRDCKAICHLLLPMEAGRPRIDGLEGQQVSRFGNRLVGYSVYVMADRTCCILLRDITEKTRLMSIAEAVNTMDNIGYIFSGIRHEIGNPINSIKMTMSVLRRNLKSFSPDAVQEYIDRTMGEIGRLEYLLKSLKNFSMFENLEIKAIDLRAFIEKFTQLAQPGLEKEGIRLQADLPAGSAMALADARALQQVMLNLLTNATASLAGRDDPRVEIALKLRPDFAWIRVLDNGCGISKKDQQHLFKPFYTTKSSGTGLGLVITRKLLVQMNCSIEIDSDEDVGTTAGISLPRPKEHGNA